MLEACRPVPPAALAVLERETKAIGFTMASDLWTGSLLRTLAASRPGGAFLELGTGTGLATAWLLDGMDERSTLLSIDTDDAVASVARRHLGHDARLTMTIADAGAHLGVLLAQRRSFDLIFADALAGKYTHLDETLKLVRPGGLFVIDDMLPQPSWPDEHPAKVAALIATLEAREDLRLTALQWATGIIVAAKVR